MDFDFNRLLADAARDMAEEPSIVTTLERAVELCTQAVEHCDMAGISVIEAGEIRTVAASDERLRKVDQLQFELRQGPCFDALRRHETVQSPDLSADPRWPAWGARMVDEMGMRSTLSYRLFTTQESIGALNLYAERPDAFDQEDLLEGQVLAAHASVALAASFKESQLHRALETRTVIGQATGILIERFGLAPDQAFAVMQRVSQNHNVKLHQLARHLVETGVLLDPLSTPRDGDGETLPGA